MDIDEDELDIRLTRGMDVPVLYAIIPVRCMRTAKTV